MATTTYDLLVVGGGISGAFIAWDAAARGLHVALVEKNDFGSATSANSLKTVHGGLRYLQDGDLRLMRTMIAERRALLRIAPHLVRPLPFVLPTGRRLSRNRLVLGIALGLNELISYDRNRGLGPDRALPSGRLLSRADCLALLPGLDADGVTGGALWYDAQLINSERFLLAVLLSAAGAGADLANYLEVIDFLRQDRRVNGVVVRDHLDKQTLAVRARLVVNAGGAWSDPLLSRLADRPAAPTFHLSAAVNLLTRQIHSTVAFGISGRPANRRRSTGQESSQLFVVPWQAVSLIGTIHIPFAGPPDTFSLTGETVDNLLVGLNCAYPGAALTRDDIFWIHQGFLPAVPGRPDVRLVRRERLIDHERVDSIPGLITAIGVKYTTARYLGQRTVDLAFRKLGHRPPPSQTAVTPLRGGEMTRFDQFRDEAPARPAAPLPPAVLGHLVAQYGTTYREPLAALAEDPCWGETLSPATTVTRAEVRHAVRAEMARKLADAVCRRTDLGAAGRPDKVALHNCATIMATELGWNRERTEQEVAEVRNLYHLPVSE